MASQKLLVLPACLLGLAFFSSAVFAQDSGEGAPILVMPVEFPVSELTASGLTEPVPEWTESAETSFGNALQATIDGNGSIHAVGLPELSEEELRIVDEHLALYATAADAGIFAVSLGGSAWAGKRENFDYTIGPGLNFLREKTGAEIALIVSGHWIKGSAGRIGLAIFAAATVGAPVATGEKLLTVGQVDLETGNIVWLNYAIGMAGDDLREFADAKENLSEVLSAYPGGKIFAP